MRVIKKFLLISFLPLQLVFGQFTLTDTTFFNDNMVDSSLTTSTDWKTEPGKLLLQTGENENLARNKSAYIVFKSRNLPVDTASRNANRLLDGSFFSPSFVQILSLNAGPGGEGTYIVIDLQAIRSVNRVKMWQLGFYPGGATNLPTHLRVRSYTIYGGLDTLAMEKLVQVPENTFGVTDDFFEKVVDIRFLKITIDVIDQVQSTVISEIQVFGKGYLPEGFYTSTVRDIGRSVNFSKVTWVAEKPEGTQISVRLRTGNTPKVDATWNDWRPDSATVSGTLLPVFEPRRYLQYQIRLGTQTLLTPKVDEISIHYDTKLVAQSTDASISPQYSTILTENIFTYKIVINKGPTDYPVDTVIIGTPTPSILSDVTIDGIKAAYSVNTFSDKIVIALSSPITASATLEAKLKCTPFLQDNRFFSTLVSKESPQNPQRVDTKTSSGVEAWNVLTTGVPKRLLIDYRVGPNPFTPNGDGINDKTRLTFFLANIAEPRVLIGNQIRKLNIKIFDLAGRLVRNLYDRDSRAAAFVASNAIEWDGKDDNGKVVRPGVYIAQIVIDSDNGGEQSAKTITVVY